MKEMLREFLEFYRNQLLVGFFKKRGKSIVIPHLIFCIERIVEQFPEQKEIRILDLGCGEGHLLRLIQQIGKMSDFAHKLKLYGFDYDDEMLESAREQNNIAAEFIKIDLRHDSLEEYYGKFDIVVEVNTLHEVYSSFVGEANIKYPKEKIEFGKHKITELIAEISKMLTPNGTFILYDGLAARAELLTKKITFEITNPILEHYFDGMVKEFTLWPISYKKEGKLITMRYHDFAWFITTFKYLNTKLWPFERRQIYTYLSKVEFAKAFHEAGLMRESIMYVSNDLGLWKNNVVLKSGGLDFPPKSVMIVASKHYVPSKYDYFVST
jgi:SAM-dependent methyltransferase